MATRLTHRQQEILTFVQRYADSHGYPPSVREIGQAMGLTSSSTVHSHLEALARKGFLRRDPSKPRALEILKDGNLPPGERPRKSRFVGQLGKLRADWQSAQPHTESNPRLTAC